jgi:hypothetical protein
MGKITQDKYIEILFNDLGFNLVQRKDLLRSRYGCRYSDELPKSVKSEVIGKLKELKEDKKEKEESEYEEDDVFDDKGTFDPREDR